MGVVSAIGRGYYAIELQGVVISEDVSSAIDRAFEAAASIPSSELNIQFVNSGESGKSSHI